MATCVVFETGRSSLISRGLFLGLSDGCFFSGMLFPRKSCKTLSRNSACGSCQLTLFQSNSKCLRFMHNTLSACALCICLSRNNTTYELNLQMLIISVCRLNHNWRWSSTAPPCAALSSARLCTCIFGWDLRRQFLSCFFDFLLPWRQ